MKCQGLQCPICISLPFGLSGRSILAFLLLHQAGIRGQSGNTVVSKRPKTPHRPNAASMVGLPPSGYRITAQDGHLASCDGNKQAITPVGVSPRRFLAVSDIGAFCFNSVVSSKSGRKLVKIDVSLGPVDVEISLRWWCYCPRWPIAPMWWA
jgi:hypothetical protein